jgi:hypothetical protein
VRLCDWRFCGMPDLCQGWVTRVRSFGRWVQPLRVVPSRVRSFGSTDRNLGGLHRLSAVDRSLCALATIFAIGFADWAIALEIQESLGGCGRAARECSAEGGSHAMALAAVVGAIGWCGVIGWLGLAIVWLGLMDTRTPWWLSKVNKAITS